MTKVRNKMKENKILTMTTIINFTLLALLLTSVRVGAFQMENTLFLNNIWRSACDKQQRRFSDSVVGSSLISEHVFSRAKSSPSVLLSSRTRKRRAATSIFSKSSTSEGDKKEGEKEISDDKPTESNKNDTDKDSSSKKDETSNEKNDKEQSNNMMTMFVENEYIMKVTKPVNDKMNDIETNLIELWSNIVATLPEPLVKAVTSFIEKVREVLPTLRTISLSFVAGGIVAIVAVVVPVFTHVDKFTEPITLFETILNDLDDRYVDEIDTEKLFETGMSAMLRSLDPYTEFEGRTEAVEMQESVSGKYGGVGLVIAGRNPNVDTIRLAPPTTELLDDDDDDDEDTNINNAIMNNRILLDDNDDGESTLGSSLLLNRANSNDNKKTEASESKNKLKNDSKQKQVLSEKNDPGITVVGAFEGYAFDAGMRVGDKILAVGDHKVTPKTTVDEVRNLLRGEPGSSVDVAFERVGVEGTQSVKLTRQLVKIHDVKAATLVGDPKNGIGYIDLRGFSEDAGREVRAAVTSLQRRTSMASNSEENLQGLVLDLRQNPGGLLTSAVDVASLFVPKGADIVSAKGRGFPSLLYRSRVDPLVSPKTKVVVLVSGNTASAAEIVSGAIQDHDVGVILGSDRTFGKGLVQNVEELPFDTALKFTVAKYYTPSGRCIQSTKYTEGGGKDVMTGKTKEDSSYISSKVEEKDRRDFYTSAGRLVRDGGGIEADVKVAAPKASALEVSLLRANLLNDYAARWSKTHELTNDFGITDGVYQDFQNFVMEKQEKKEVDLLAQIYGQPFEALQKALKQSSYSHTLKSEFEALRASILKEMKSDFSKYRKDIKEDLEQAILARYLPESMLIEKAIKHDVQVRAALDLMKNRQRFDSLLARTSSETLDGSKSFRVGQLANTMARSSFGVQPLESENDVSARLNLNF